MTDLPLFAEPQPVIAVLQSVIAVLQSVIAVLDTAISNKKKDYRTCTDYECVWETNGFVHH